jgi:hypothetical protein
MNQLTGSIPSQLKELTSLIILSLCTWWIGLSCSYACLICLLTFPCHYIIWTDFNELTGSIPSELKELTSLLSLEIRTWIGLDWFVLFVWMSLLLTFPCHSIGTDSNRLTGPIPGDLKALTSLTGLFLRTWIGFGLSCSYECHACLLTFHCHSIGTDSNRLTGSIPSELGELTSLIVVYLCTWWIGLSCWHE